MVATSCDLNAPTCTTTVLAGTFSHLSMTVFVGRSVKDSLRPPAIIISIYIYIFKITIPGAKFNICADVPHIRTIFIHTNMCIYIYTHSLTHRC